MARRGHGLGPRPHTVGVEVRNQTIHLESGNGRQCHSRGHWAPPGRRRGKHRSLKWSRRDCRTLLGCKLEPTWERGEGWFWAGVEVVAPGCGPAAQRARLVCFRRPLPAAPLGGWAQGRWAPGGILASECSGTCPQGSCDCQAGPSSLMSVPTSGPGAGAGEGLSTPAEREQEACRRH